MCDLPGSIKNLVNTNVHHQEDYIVWDGGDDNSSSTCLIRMRRALPPLTSIRHVERVRIKTQRFGRSFVLQYKLTNCLNWTAITKYHKLGVYRQQKCTSHSSKGWKSEIRVPTLLSSGKSPFWGCGLSTSHSILLMAEKEPVSSLTFSSRGPNCIHEGSTSWPNYLPKAPPPNIITLRFGFQHMNLGEGGGAQTFSL